MFKNKYKISILDSKWQPIKRNLKVEVIPRVNEYLYMDEKYHKVINVIHTMDKKQDIFVIIEELTTQYDSDNERVTKKL
jgi:hypothetical protein